MDAETGRGDQGCSMSRTTPRRPKGAKSTTASTDTEFCQAVEAEILDSRRVMARSDGERVSLRAWPHLREVVDAATDDARQKNHIIKGPNHFGHRGWRGYYVVTNIGRVIVHTLDGVPAASSGFGALWGEP